MVKDSFLALMFIQATKQALLFHLGTPLICELLRYVERTAGRDATLDHSLRERTCVPGGEAAGLLHKGCDGVSQ